jgi:hypothetical protein
MSQTNLSSRPGLLIAAAAGLAAALLFSLARQGTLLATLLAYFSPLPIMIAALGFGRTICAAAAAIGCLGVFSIVMLRDLGGTTHALGPLLLTGGVATTVFLFSQGLPACWLGYLAGLSRDDGSQRWSLREVKPSPATRFYPIGRLFSWTTAIATALVAAGLVAISLRYASYETAIDLAAKALMPLVQTTVGTERELLAGLDLQSLTRALVRMMPAAVAASSVVMLLANLWFAGRVVQLSDRLVRPWPDVPAELRAPRIFAPAFLIALALSLFDGIGGAMATIAAATIGMALALQGLAVVHDLSRGSKLRFPLLFLIYTMLVLLMPWPLPVFSLIGLAEAGFALRDRKSSAARSKTTEN